MVKFNERKFLEWQAREIGILLIIFALIIMALISFVKSDIDERDVFLCDAVSSNPDLSMTDCPAHKEGTSWFIILAFGVDFLILLSGVYLTFATIFTTTKKEEGQKPEFKKIDISKLSEEEKRVYEVIKQKEGSMYQSELIKETGFSKVKMTRILDRMTGRGVVDRKRRGMTNIVILK
ncbi:hypothetical protein HY643_03135 [Candidatus Woesearchaeota archaeon]|nr:hypothetical protein [Candidatus Woesearchaeota archaeon]